MAKWDKYHPNYKMLYPGVEITKDVLKCLKQSDRKMEYMEIDIKREKFCKDTAGFIPSREDSLERLRDEAKIEFAAAEATPEEITVHNDDIDRLCKAVKRLSPEERALIHAVFFDNKTEAALANQVGVSQQAISKKIMRIYRKIKIFMKN